MPKRPACEDGGDDDADAADAPPDPALCKTRVQRATVLLHTQSSCCTPCAPPGGRPVREAGSAAAPVVQVRLLCFPPAPARAAQEAHREGPGRRQVLARAPHTLFRRPSLTADDVTARAVSCCGITIHALGAAMTQV